MDQATRYCEQARVTDNIVSSGAEGGIIGPVVSRKKKTEKALPRVPGSDSSGSSSGEDNINLPSTRNGRLLNFYHAN